MCKSEFDANENAEPSYVDKMVAQLLIEKFDKISNKWVFQEELEHEDAGKIID